MKKSFKVLLLALLALSLFATAGFARTDYSAIKKAAGDAAKLITGEKEPAKTDYMVISLISTMTGASAAVFNPASNDATLKTAFEKSKTSLNNYAATLGKTLSKDIVETHIKDVLASGDDLAKAGAAYAIVNTDLTAEKSGATDDKLKAVANAFGTIDFKADDLKVFGKFFEGPLSSDSGASSDVAKAVGNFYTIAGDNLGAFKKMLPSISAYLNTKPKATPLDVFTYISKDLQVAFISADIKVTATGGTNTSSTLKVAAASSDIYKLIVDYGATVSFDFGTSSADVVSAEVSSGSLASKDYVYSATAPVTSGDSIDVTFGFASGDSSVFAFVVKVIASGDSGTETTETYLLKVSDITLTPANAVSNTAKLISADTDNYSATLDLTNLNSTASGDWGSAGTITVSSDYLGGSFSITVSTDAKLVNVYVQNGTAWDELDTDEVSGDVITPNTVGTYKAVLSADLIASNDKTVSGDAYFAFNVIIASVDESSKGDETKTVSPEDAPTSVDANGNKVLDENSDPVANKFSSGTTASSALINQFFTTATALPVLSESRITALLESIGYTADDLGDETDGYKAIAFELPYTLVAGQPYFALLTDNDNGTGTKTYLGFGYIPEKLGGTKTMVILFKLLRNPNNPKEFMSFPAGKYFVGATNDGTSSASNNTRALFMTANGETFNIKSNEAKLLQGQTTSGTAEPYEESSGDETTDEVSSHGSSSGCDAGFGALALLAVAGALAARKVRK